MYPRAFHYHRAGSLKEAVTMLSQLGGEAKLLAGGQSLIPLMKLRFANPSHLVDLNFISGTSYIKEESNTLRFGALTRHAEIESSDVAAKIPILHDCAAGIADVQVRNRGTIGGSLAEADPSGDWATVLLTLSTEVRCLGTNGERGVRLSDFIKDAYTTILGNDELVTEVVVKTPSKGSSGAYLAFKRSAPVYPTVSAGQIHCHRRGSRPSRSRPTIRHARIGRLQAHLGRSPGKASTRNRLAPRWRRTR
jgi:carbon-monoxide dehydrogenase medium subunit